MTHPIIIKDLSFKYEKNSKDILNKVNLSVHKGEILAIVGLSGIGKSTLCYCMSGIIPHVYKGMMEGEILIKGKPTLELTLPQIATHLGIVFQNPDTQLFSPTVEDEIAFGPENLCLERDEIGRRIDEMLSKVGMEKYRLSSPNNLSGGQKQLIALASVLSLNPEILIFDESMSQIDADGRIIVKEMMKKLKGEGKTIIMIEHEFENLDIADRVMLLKDGDLVPFQGTLL
ncbi:MAG: Energy-coupling factor transporter ATP-binding protein EcfA1 [candidate division WS2 bacterium]|nr:Energy-coupling factor transporter ATP-binding protein EcfA1 [Candidatus Psychracetigena formicireducens]